jgi:hypothetical protein
VRGVCARVIGEPLLECLRRQRVGGREGCSLRLGRLRVALLGNRSSCRDVSWMFVFVVRVARVLQSR